MGKAAVNVPVIQYLRGIAAIMVVVAHAADQIGPAAAVLSKIGTAGVDIFFVISGFVMTYTASVRKYSRAEFIWRRLVRIVPIYWVATCVAALLAVFAPTMFKHTTFTWSEFFTSLFFIPFPNPATGGASPLLKLGWTLNYEMMFYLLFCVLLPWRTAWRFVALAAVFGIGYIASKMVPLHSAALEFYGRPITFEFVLGCIAGWLIVAGANPPRALVTICLVLSVALFVRYASFMPQTMLFCGVPAAVIVTCLVTIHRSSSWRSKILHIAGDASYSVYCTHLFVIMAIAHLWASTFAQRL